MIILCVLFHKYSFVPKRHLVLSVCLSVCLSPKGRNFNQIFRKLHHMVEFVIMKKPIVFEVKRSTSVKDQQLRRTGWICDEDELLDFGEDPDPRIFKVILHH